MWLKITVQIVDFEEKRNFLVLSLARKLMHCLDKFCERYCPTSIFVKYPKCPLHKKFLKDVTSVWLIDCVVSRDPHISRWHNFLELVKSKFLLPFAHVLSENLFQPSDVLLIQNSAFSKIPIQG